MPGCWPTGTASDDTELGRKMPDRCARACSRAALNTELRGEASTHENGSKPERQIGKQTKECKAKTDDRASQ